MSKSKRPTAKHSTPRKSKPRPQGSFIRRQLVGPTPLERLEPDARQFIEQAQALDQLLLKRGWTFRPDSVLVSCLEWEWAATPGHDAPVFDDQYQHELRLETTIGYYFDRLEPMELAVALAGNCAWGDDVLLSQDDLIAEIERYEAHWEPDESQHACQAAGVVLGRIEPERAERENLFGTEGPLPFPVSLIGERSEQIARAHLGADARTVRREMELSSVVVHDRRGVFSVHANPFLAGPFALINWAVANGHITWDQSNLAYRCTDAAALLEDIVDEFDDLVDAGQIPIAADDLGGFSSLGIVGR